MGPHICVFKTHVDVFDKWSDEFAAKLQQLAEKHGERAGVQGKRHPGGCLPAHDSESKPGTRTARHNSFPRRGPVQAVCPGPESAQSTPSPVTLQSQWRLCEAQCT